MSMSNDDLDLLAAGYTAMLGFKVINPHRSDQSLTTILESALSLGNGGGYRPKISTYEIFHTAQFSIFPMIPQTHSFSPFVSLESARGGRGGYEEDDDIYDVNVKIINKGITTVQARKSQRARDIKAAISEKLGIPLTNQVLMIGGKPFHDYQTISMLVPTPPPIKPEGYVRPTINCVGGEKGPYELDCSDLDPQYNYDFSNEQDDGQEYIRGGHVYKRPYGWKRFAVKVKDLYNNNTWLGEDGIRIGSTTGEWPVSYHGTKHEVVNKIIENGFIIGSGGMYGPGVYTSPSLEFCEKYYCENFKYKSNMWTVALQNRVNPAEGHLDIIPPDVAWGKVEFWRSPKQDIENKIYDVRPYGVLFKKVG